MLEGIRQLKVHGLWYGALDLGEGGVAPVLQLGGLARVRRWVDALDRFDASGDYGVFAPLLIENGVESDKARWLERAAFYERTLNLPEALKQLRKLNAFLDRSELHGASRLFARTLKDRLAWSRRGSLAEHQKRLAWEHLGRSDYLRAVVFGWEALTTKECDQVGLPSVDYQIGRRLGAERLF